MSQANFSRRRFLEFMGQAGAFSALSQFPLSEVLAATTGSKDLPFSPLPAMSRDEVVMAEGFQYQMLLRSQQVINKAGEKFGFNNDYLAFIPIKKGATDEGLLWVNHESFDPFLLHHADVPRTKEYIDKELDVIGGSIVHIKKSKDKWSPVLDSSYNRRLNGRTEIPLIAPREIEGSKIAIGTMANCAGGITPWGTVLTCEENYHNFWGDFKHRENGKKEWKSNDDYLGWREIYPRPPEHYGWVVEVDVFTGKAKKLTSIGRYSHECATTIVAKDGRCVAYSGDDKAGGFIYKFISRQAGSLEEGQLFVANTESGRWVEMNIEDSRLKGKFKDQTDVLIRAREAGKQLGATPQDRPEDIEIDPKTKAVYISLTENKDRNNLFGSILKLEEKNRDPLSLEFKSSTFVAGGEKSGVSCPDNLAFDKAGNLWMTCDVSPKYLNKGQHKVFGNNSLFYIPLSGPKAGQVLRVASAPNEAEFTGPQFSPDGRTLFLSVQHPGEKSKSADKLHSHWPDGGKSWPQSCVIQISGPALDKLVNA